MAGSFSGKITWTEDPMVFQKQCKGLLAAELSDPNVELRGTAGQRQQGIDLRGRRLAVARDHWVGAQCKLKIKGQRLDLTELRTDAEAALSIDPPLCEFIILTNAANDIRAQDLAAKITAEQADKGRDYKITVWASEEITERSERHPEVFRSFFPDALPHMNQLLEGDERIEAALVETSALIADGNRALALQISRLQAALVDDAGATGNLTTALDREITAYRQAANSGSPVRALADLNALLASLPENADAHIRFRAVANIAGCHLHLGDFPSAGARYLEAYEIEPGLTRAKSLRALGYVCVGRYEDAIRWATEVLADPASAEPELVVYMYGAAKLDGSLSDPGALVPERLLDDPKVAAARIDFWRARGDSRWRSAARAEFERWPKNQDLADLDREATLSEIVDQVTATSDRMLTGDQRASLLSIAEVLRLRWFAAMRSDAGIQDDDRVLCLNLVTAYRVLKDYVQAKRTLLEALERRPGDQELLAAQLTVAMETDDYRLAEQANRDLLENRDTVMARVVILANESRWPDLVEAIETTSFALDSRDLATLQCLRLVAQAKLGVREGLREAGERLTHDNVSIAVPVQLYEVARTIGDVGWASSLYAIALERQDDLDSATRLMLSAVAEHEDDPATVILLLSGHIETARDSEELRRLARSYVNSAPRASTPAFLASLPTQLAETPYYAQMIGGIYFNMGSLDLASQAFATALRGDPFSALAHSGLLNTYRRLDRLDLFTAHLASLRIERLRGPAIERISLAQMMIHSGYEVDGFALAYSITKENPNDPDVVKAYIGCVLGSREKSVLTDAVEIGVGWAVTIERDDRTARLSLVIDEQRAGVREPDVVPPGHPTAQALLGKRVGDEIVLVPDIGTAQQWKVVSARSKYLALWDEIRETFQAKFPDEPGFKQFSLTDNDLAPMLEIVRKGAEFGSQVAELYQTQAVPLVSLASATKTHSVDFALSLAQDDIGLRTCLGNEPERSLAAESIDHARTTGIVLDTLAAWTAAALALFPVIRPMFPRVAVVQSTLDELRIWRDEPKYGGLGEGRMSVGYRDGEFFRTEVTEDQLKQRRDRINLAIDEVRNNCEVLPGLVPDDLSDIERILIEKFGNTHDLDAVFAAEREGCLLISEDLRLRKLADEGRRVPGAWLQPVLMAANASGQLSQRAYAGAIAELATLRHEGVAVRSADLVALIDQNKGHDGFSNFRTLAGQLAGPGSEFSSHERVIAETMSRLYGSLPFAQAERYLGTMLERLMVLHGRAGRKPTEFFQWLMRRDFPPEVLDYFRRWALGHFVPVE